MIIIPWTQQRGLQNSKVYLKEKNMCTRVRLRTIYKEYSKFWKAIKLAHYIIRVDVPTAFYSLR